MPNQKESYFTLTIRQIAFLLDKHPSSTQQKANRQKWPFEGPERRNPGAQQRIYKFEYLPDEVQVAWSKWDTEQRERILKEQLAMGSKGFPDDVLPELTVSNVLKVLRIPIRYSYGQHGSRVWDEKSFGLCVEARRVLEDRFPNIKDRTEPVPDEDTLSQLVLENTCNKYRLEKIKLVEHYPAISEYIRSHLAQENNNPKETDRVTKALDMFDKVLSTDSTVW